MPDHKLTVPLLDLGAQYATIRQEVERAVLRVLDEQRFILGPEVQGLEAEVADHSGVTHAVGVSSGTDALLMAMMALGVGAGDEVITTTYSFFATAGSIVRLGARPVLVDIEPETFNIDPRGVAARITPRTRAILPVHLFGRCADLDRLAQVAPGIPLVEDAAQAIGARWRGKQAGALGTLGCFSFFPSKNLGGCGDGGMITTDDDQLAETLRALRVHGRPVHERHHHLHVGGNFRLDALQAAILRVKLRHLGRWTAARRDNAGRYRTLFRAAEAPLRLPPQDAQDSHDVYNQFVVRVAAERRDPLLAHLKEQGVGCAVYYPLGLHQQPALAHLGHKQGDFPHAEAAARESLALPVYPELTLAQQERVVEVVTDFLES